MMVDSVEFLSAGASVSPRSAVFARLASCMYAGVQDMMIDIRPSLGVEWGGLADQAASWQEDQI